MRRSYIFKSNSLIAFLFTFFFGAYSLPAFANSGLLVSLTVDKSIQGAVQVTLTSSVGKKESIQLVDNGEKPDVAAGDGQYSGAMMLPAGEYTVVLSTEDGSFEGDSFEMPDDSKPRDLYLSLSGGSLRSKMGVAAGGAQEATIHRSEAMNGDVSGGTPNGPPIISAENATKDALTPKGASKKSEKSKTNLFYPLIAVIAITLAGTAFILLKPDGNGKIDSRLKLIPQPGLMGEGTPSIDDGFVQWIVDPQHQSQFTHELTTSLSAYERTLLVSPDPIDAPSILGASIFVLVESDSFEISDVIESLAPSNGILAVCFINVIKEESDISDYIDALPKNTTLNSIQSEVITQNSIHVAVERDDTWAFQVSRPENDDNKNQPSSKEEGEQITPNEKDVESDKPEST